MIYRLMCSFQIQCCKQLYHIILGTSTTILSHHDWALGHYPLVIVQIACIHSSTSVHKHTYFILLVDKKTDIEMNRWQRVINRNMHRFLVRRGNIRKKYRNSEETGSFITVVPYWFVHMTTTAHTVFKNGCGWSRWRLTSYRVTGYIFDKRRTWSLPCMWDVSPKFLPINFANCGITVILALANAMRTRSTTKTTKEAIRVFTNVTVRRVLRVTFTILFYHYRSRRIDRGRKFRVPSDGCLCLGIGRIV